MTKPRKKSTKVPKRLRAPKTPPPRLLPASPSASPGRPRTAVLPGLEAERGQEIEEIRDLALKYFHLRDQKLALAKKEKAAGEALLEVMHAMKLKRYFDTEAQVLVEIEEASEKLRVTVGEEERE